MSDKVRIAFVGCGGHASGALYPQFARIAEIDLVAVVDQIEEKRLVAQRTWGARRAYASVEEMLDKEKPEGVCISGPPQMHYEVGLQVLERGIPIFVEKPSAIDFQHAYDLAEAARKAGTFGMTAFMKRFATAYEKAKEITQREEFGPVSMVSVRYTHGAYPSIWGIEDRALVCLIGNQCHAFDLARYFGGDVTELYARLCDRGEGCFAFAVTLQFENGAVGLLNSNATDDPSWNIRETLNVSGLLCSVDVEDMIHVNYRPRERWAPELGPWREGLYALPHAVSFNLGGRWLGYEGELRHFAQCIRGEVENRSSLYDGAASLAIAEAIWESAKTGKPVRPKSHKPGQ
ncbi:MAG TPA: Gfo/Idh/MocA family oxidoreductase [Armatimonadota bacterium]|nr:Gfo/Idh/MocA family oxidoreductase [Armatimonadota bacterium]HOJ20405.1 Gfo/Idh/MocA family oxidoreductase [Armatimonadota bacterium]HOM80576.1 Gfo/Idh/MocA family oxidoreductase [Armatimonadota bacterium]HOQ29334.1 Gfo/Idh/MocA family oxidoreductase [Armatimonadota bacterium]HPO72557.1 Gfo/Idh/MocA family oxidoreductase [Armatimonadota bacterium]